MIIYRLTEEERRTYHAYASLALPRHTSYPIPSFWNPEFGPADFRDALSRSAQQRRPLSLYVHIPFCERLCYYCACTKEIIPPGRRRELEPSEPFLDALEIETDRLAGLVGTGEVRQVHLGGGSPTFLGPRSLQRLGDLIRRRFLIAPDAEIAVEVDPRITTREQLEILHGFGFNRISLGIQDFAPQVQQAVNRIQPFALVERCMGWCRDLGFASVNFDLIYGLPFQTQDTMADTLEKTLTLSPDRIAFYRLAVIPEIFRWQKVFRPSDLPDGEETLELNLLAINRLQEAGYEFIGLDHFARSTEPLAQAVRDGSLRRTFQGMTTGKGLDILGLGPSAVSQLDDAFAQNRKTTGSWQQALLDTLATERGLRLSEDDRLRRELLQELYGYGTITRRGLEDHFGIDFDTYFAPERERLAELVEQGLVVSESDRIRLTVPLGRLLVRVVAAVFDRYLPAAAFREGLAAAQASRVG